MCHVERKSKGKDNVGNKDLKILQLNEAELSKCLLYKNTITHS